MGLLFRKGSCRTTPRRGLSALVFGLALMVGAPAALGATEEETAGARAMAQQGLEAFKAERYQEAADLFSRAESLVHSPVHLLYKARAHSKLGELVKAQEAYILIIREKLPASAPAAFRNAQETAPAELEQVKPRLARLTVTVVGPEEGAQVTLDGEPVPAALLGVAMPVDPGEHKLEASAEGYTSDSVNLTMAEAQREGIELRLEPVVAAAPAAPVAPGSAATNSDPGLDPGPQDGGGVHQGLRIGSYVAFGVGAVGLGLGTVFLLDGSSKGDEADEIFAGCKLFNDGDLCTPDQRSEILGLDSDSDSATHLGIGGLVLGGVGVATGVVLFILSNDSGEPTANAPRLTPWVGLNSAGLSGTF